MVLFLAINTSSITLLPTGVIALRASAGSADPAGILPTTLFATVCSTIVAITAALAYRRFSRLYRPAARRMQMTNSGRPTLRSKYRLQTAATPSGYPGLFSADFWR